MVVLKNGSFSFIFFREYRPGKFVLRYSSKETRFGLKISFITKGNKLLYFACAACYYPRWGASGTYNGTSLTMYRRSWQICNNL